MKGPLRFLAIAILFAVLAGFAAPSFAALAFSALAFAAQDSFQFVILGDRTGEAQPGVYEQVWREAAARNPAFLVSVVDNIQGDNDGSAEAEWRAWQQIVTPYRRFPLYLT